MPAQKRSYESVRKVEEDNEDPQQQEESNDHEDQQRRHQKQKQDLGNDHGGDGGDAADGESDRSPGSSDEGEKEEFVIVKLSEIRKEVQCPICLGIIRKTRTVMECLHRFCRECIDKSMRLGNNECPACRTHCASRRSLRDDPNYDALIAALYPDIDKYEEEELAFQEEDQARNKQIQASIAQTFHRQTEALGKRRTRAKRRMPSRYRDAHLRPRRKYRTSETQGSDDNEDVNVDGGKDSSSADDQGMEIRPKRNRRSSGTHSPAVNADGSGDEDDSEVNRDSLGASAGFVSPSKSLSWGKGGMRSSTRHGSASGSNNIRNGNANASNKTRNGSASVSYNTCNGTAVSSNGKNGHNRRIAKLANCLQNLEENDNQLDIHLMLLSLDEQVIPSLQRPYLCCRSTLSVKHLCQYIAFQTATLKADEVEIYLVKELHAKNNNPSPVSNLIADPAVIDPSKDVLQVLEEQKTLAGLETFGSTHGHVLLAYQKKLLKS